MDSSCLVSVSEKRKKNCVAVTATQNAYWVAIAQKCVAFFNLWKYASWNKHVENECCFLVTGQLTINYLWPTAYRETVSSICRLAPFDNNCEVWDQRQPTRWYRDSRPTVPTQLSALSVLHWFYYRLGGRSGTAIIILSLWDQLTAAGDSPAPFVNRLLPSLWGWVCYSV